MNINLINLINFINYLHRQPLFFLPFCENFPIFAAFSRCFERKTAALNLHFDPI